MNTHKPTLVLNGTGKVGRRVVERLTARGLPVRVGSRWGEPRFDWEDPSTWAPALEGVGSAYVAHYWDAIPGAAETLGSFAELAVESGVPRLVLLSGRGEEEAVRGAQAVRDSGAELTVLHSTWFAQNFSEDYMLDYVLSGEVALPAEARRLGQAQTARWIVAALAFYAVTVVVTVVVHFPLNEDIKDAGDPARIDNLAQVRDDFAGPWAAWNIVRTLALTAALGCLAWALVLRARTGRAEQPQPTDRYVRG